jgi:hypothetical protein
LVLLLLRVVHGGGGAAAVLLLLLVVAVQTGTCYCRSSLSMLCCSRHFRWAFNSDSVSLCYMVHFTK